MNRPLRVLYLEDDIADAELARDTLELDGFVCDVTRVETESGFRAALQQGGFDVILADYALPSFDGLSALKITLWQRSDLPFIFVSGTMGEEVAIEALKIGATDYVLKTRMSRLVPSVHRALREARERAELRRAEEALRRSEVKIRRLVDANIVGVLISDIEGRVIDANDAFLHMIRYTRDDLACGRLCWTELTPPEWQPASERAVAQLRANGTCELFEKEYFRSDGTRVPVLVAAAAIEGTETENVAFALDLTERKLAEAERERLRQLQVDLAYMSRVITVGQLGASLAHEIKQPIGAAVTNAEACVRILNRDGPDLPEAREAALEMVRDARRAADIIDRVRSLYQKGSSEPAMVDVNEVIGEMVVMLRSEANRHSVSMRADLAEGLPTVMADRVQLQQALMNLMLNGIEAMNDASGELSVRSKTTEDGQLLVSVSDCGIGLPVKYVERIFDAFFTTKPHGTGMGLSISRTIIESYGGHLWATPNAERGATFHFTLPTEVKASSPSAA
jgi:PAS domain S-box-containing protein